MFINYDNFSTSKYVHAADWCPSVHFLFRKVGFVTSQLKWYNNVWLMQISNNRPDIGNCSFSIFTLIMGGKH